MSSAEISNQGVQAIDTQLQIEPVQMNIEAFDQKLNNTSLLGGEQGCAQLYDLTADLLKLLSL